MNYLPILSEDEIRYICYAIPVRDAAVYFQRNSKEFAKIRPGFRINASSLAKLDIGGLLFNYSNRGLISSFIEQSIDIWLNEIQKHHQKCLNNGDSEQMALLRTLSYSFFAGNIELYFKLTEDEYSDEVISLLGAAVRLLKENDDCIEAQKDVINSKESTIMGLNSKLESNNNLLENNKRRLARAKVETTELRTKIREIEHLKANIREQELETERLREESISQADIIHRLRAELAETIKSRQLLESQMRDDIEKQNAMQIRERVEHATPKCPKDMDEFLDYLGYNFEALGLESDDEYFPLLKSHLSKIMFSGLPIIVNHCTGIALMQCVSNALIGTPVIEILTYKEGITLEEIDNYLFSTKRIVCLDNFIGNYNETLLIPIFDKHKGQIVFLTHSYERTLKYISSEFLRYGNYLNLNKIDAFSNGKELSEDPSVIEESECTISKNFPNNRFSALLQEVMNDLGYPDILIEKLCATVANEDDLCRILAFDVLPYCVDVLHITPFNISERLIKYAGANGRCQYKELFRRWFA